MNAQAAAITILGEVDCITNCATADYSGELDGDQNDTPTDGDQAPPADDDDRADPDGAGAECVIPQGQSSCTFTYSRADNGHDELTFWVTGHASGETDDEAVVTQDDDEVDAVEKFWENRVATDLDCQPDDDTNPSTDDPNVGGAENQHTITCQASDQFGDPVGGEIDGEFTSGPNDPDNGNNAPVDIDNCNGGGTNPCTFTYTNTGNNAGTDTICFFIDDAGTDDDLEECATPEAFNADDPSTNSEDTVRKTWAARNAGQLDCTPEDATNAPTDTTHTITCTARDQFGALAGGVEIDGETLAGSANDADGTTAPPDHVATTNNAGVATFNVSDTRPAGNFANRVDTFCFWVDDDGNSNNLEECAAPEALNDANETDDEQDVVRKTYEGGVAPNTNAATSLDAAPNSATNNINTRHDIFVIARDAQGNPTQGETATNTGAAQCPQAGPGTGPGTSCPSRVRADIFQGPNLSQTVVVEMQCARTGNSNAAPGATPTAANATHVCSYTGTNPGTDQIRVFYDTNNDGQFTAGEPNEVVTKTWAGAAGSVTVTPQTDEAPVGTCNPFTVTVRDPQNNPVQTTVDVRQTFNNPPAAGQPGQPNITFCNPGAGTGANPQGPVNQNPAGNTESSPGALPNAGPGTGGQPNTRHAEFTTDATGQATFGIQSNTQGTVSLQIWVETVDNDVFDPQNNEPGTTATKTWTPGGQAAARNLTATPANDTNPRGTLHTITATVTNQAGQQLQGVNVAMQFSQNSANNPGAIVQCQNPTSNTGTVQCTYTGNNLGTDTIVVFVNQGGSAGPDAGEPQQTVTKTWTAPPAGLSIDLTCGGTVAGGANRPPAQGESVNDAETRRETCVNPLTDADEVFTVVVTDAAQTRRSGIRVNFTTSVTNNGQTTNGVGSATDVNFTGGSGTGAQSIAECDTDANGSCSVTLTNPSPQNGDAVSVTATIAGQVGGNNNDTATKTWQSPVASNLVLTPRAATNQVGTQHTVTATIQSQFGETLTATPGVTVDFRIFAGPNNGLSQLDTPLTNGQATFTFSSPIVGIDRILACAETTAQGGGGDNDICNLGTGTGPNNAPAGGIGGEPFGEASKTWQTGAVTTGAVALDMDADSGGCEVATPTDPNRERTATNTINPTDATDANNFHRICASAFQGAGGNQGAISGAPITFTITGVGRIYAATPQGTCATNVVPAAGTSQTVTANEAGIAHACLYSQQVGRTNVTASAGTPAVSDTGTKDWTVGTERARNIQLCHGDVAGTTCETDPQTNDPGDEHQLTARVTDVQGNPVAGAPVQFRETGPAIFTPQGGSTATVTTDANGLASVLMVSDVQGVSTVVAEIMSGVGNNNTRGGGATDDQCEQPAGQGGTPTAGNCISQTLTKNWQPTVIEPECNDGEDNDGDGFIDFGTAETNDPGCSSATDDSEDPFNRPDPDEIPHGRRISIRFNDGTGARNNGLVVFGRLRLAGDGTNPDCFRQVPVNIQRRINGRWVTKKSTDTNRRGRYAVEIFDQASRYRAVAPRVDILDEDLNQLHVCQRTAKVKRHRHRR